MADEIIDGTETFNGATVMYTAPKANPAGGKVVNIWNKAFAKSYTIQTPLLLTWGASENVDQEGKALGKYSMSLQMPSSQYPDADGEAFLATMKALEDKVRTDALTYSKEWFGKQYSVQEVVDALFTPMLKYPKIKGTQELDLTKAPTLNVKLPCWKGQWKSEIYNEECDKLFPSLENPALTPLDFLKKGSKIACIIQCGGIWFVNGKFSITWNLVQAVVKTPKDSIQGKCVIKLKDSQKAQLKASEDPVDNGIGEENMVSAHIESDGEEEMILEVPVKAPAPSPAPAPVEEKPAEESAKPVVKRTAVRKKTT